MEIESSFDNIIIIKDFIIYYKSVSILPKLKKLSSKITDFYKAVKKTSTKKSGKIAV